MATSMCSAISDVTKTFDQGGHAPRKKAIQIAAVRNVAAMIGAN